MLRGKAAIRPYRGGGLAAAKPPLKFELLDAYAGVNTVAIHYRSVGHKYVVEVIEFNEQRVAIRGSACAAPVRDMDEERARSRTYVGKASVMADLLRPLSMRLARGNTIRVHRLLAEGDFVVVQATVCR